MTDNVTLCISSIIANNGSAPVNPALWGPLISVSGILGGALLCWPVTRKLSLKWLLATALYLAADAELLTLAPRLPGSHWNWLGKMASVLLGLLVLRLSGITHFEAGLVMPHKRHFGWVMIGVISLVLFSTISNLGEYRQSASFESVSYQAIMPGLTEELVYRGIVYSMLVRAFGSEGVYSEIVAILISSCCFALAHIEPPRFVQAGFSWNLLFVFAMALQFGQKFIVGMILAITRWRTHSLLGPFLAHGTMNVVSGRLG